MELNNKLEKDSKPEQPETVANSRSAELAETLKKLSAVPKFIIGTENGETATDYGQLDPEAVLQCARDFDLGNSALIVKLFSGKYMYFDIYGKIQMWNSGLWTEIPEANIQKDVMNLLHKVYLYTAFHFRNLRTKLETENSETNKEEIKNLEKKDKICLNAAKQAKIKKLIKPAIGLATGYHEFQCLEKQSDSNLYEINLLNGVYNLKTHTFRIHDPNIDRFLKQAGTSYDPNAKCPIFDNFMNVIFEGNTEVISFVLQWYGLCLTGDVSNQSFLYNYGTGANGKSTLINLMQCIYGSYCTTIGINTLLNKPFENSSDSYEKANLKGARIALSTEIPAGQKMNESLVKTLTGGDTITARHPYGKVLNIIPTHKLVMCGNHKLTIIGQDYAIWRRVLLLHFKVQIPDEQKDTNLLEKLKNEMPGILNKLMAGYKDYTNNGYKLTIPAEVIQATEAYKTESDTELRDFLENCCDTTDTTSRTLLKDIWECYTSWVSSGEVKFKRSQDLSTALQLRQFKYIKPDNKVTFLGIKLKN